MKQEFTNKTLVNFYCTRTTTRLSTTQKPVATTKRIRKVFDSGDDALKVVAFLGMAGGTILAPATGGTSLTVSYASMAT